MNKEKYCISFSGPIGSSKTPIAYYLSQSFNLPMINNDTIRTEVTEDLGKLDQVEYEKRRDQRTIKLLESGISFIFDASIDRSWDVFHGYLTKYEYSYFIISMDLSREFLINLYKAKNYPDSFTTIDRFLADHENFLEQHPQEINIHITDQTFQDRLELSKNKLSEWLQP